ncbi:MAG: hypothetical protein WDN28_33795 [Chthoniobacter sp.]
MIERDLKDISEVDLQDLISQGAGEGKTLEFKRELDITNPDSKLKFLRGIASFANASEATWFLGWRQTKRGRQRLDAIGELQPRPRHTTAP